MILAYDHTFLHRTEVNIKLAWAPPFSTCNAYVLQEGTCFRYSIGHARYMYRILFSLPLSPESLLFCTPLYAQCYESLSQWSNSFTKHHYSSLWYQSNTLKTDGADGQESIIITIPSQWHPDIPASAQSSSVQTAADSNTIFLKLFLHNHWMDLIASSSLRRGASYLNFETW